MISSVSFGFVTAPTLKFFTDAGKAGGAYSNSRRSSNLEFLKPSPYFIKYSF
jgi:hypothetical protein